MYRREKVKNKERRKRRKRIGNKERRKKEGGRKEVRKRIRVCQVKCVSSFLHLFPQLSAV